MLEPGLVELRAIAATCTLTALDVHGGANAAVLVSPGGGSLKLSRSAAALLELARTEQDDDVIAARFGTDRTGLEAAAVKLAGKIRTTLGAVDARRPPGFFAQRTLVAAPTVSRWSSPLAGLFAPVLAVPLIGVALATVIFARQQDPRGALPTYALWAGFAIGLVLMFIHELGHAAACRRQRTTVGPIGCALYLIYPAFYCDVTHTWSLSRARRVVVDLGGAYFQLLATAVVAAIWQVTDWPIALAALRVSLATMALNLLPVGRLDGYWVLSDALGIVDLRGQQLRLIPAAWAWLRRRPTGLPWPWWTTLAIAGYAIATAWFVATLLLRFLPHVAAEAWQLPDRFAALATAHGSAGYAGALGHLASSLVIAIIGVVIVRGLGRSVITLGRRAAARMRLGRAVRDPRSPA
ncbi:MAG: hypothetical protein ABI678_22075 [Kofleriaceae bacterium]